MKAIEKNEGHSRNILFTGLPGDTPEVLVHINSYGPHGKVVDETIIPSICEAVKLVELCIEPGTFTLRIEAGRLSNPDLVAAIRQAANRIEEGTEEGKVYGADDSPVGEFIIVR